MDRPSAFSMVTRALALVALVVAESLWLQSSGWGRGLVAALQGIYAETASAFLGLVGLDARLDGIVIRTGGAPVEVTDDCVGLDVGLFLGSAMLVYPAPLRRKVVGCGAALGVVMVLNWMRVVMLTLLAQGAPAVFEVTHVYVWPGLLIAVCVGVFVAWLRGLEPATPMAS
jgi:exosortase/archaeosortase family protein